MTRQRLPASVAASALPWLALAALLIASACQRKAFDAPVTLGGVEVAAETLNQGKRVYEMYCETCHGHHGDGQGSQAASMQPPPRDFRPGLFKFAAVTAGALPTDDDLLRTLRRGLNGTHMPSWASIPEDKQRAVVHFIKTFSPRWQQEKQGVPLPLRPDPWGAAQREAAVARGEAIYHGLARCWTCHPAYLSRDQLAAAASQPGAAAAASQPGAGTTAETEPPQRKDVHTPAEVLTEHGRVHAPDFLADKLRAGKKPQDLYRAIASGIGGTPMPSWFEKLPPADLWAVIYYVENLQRMQGTPAAQQLRTQITEAPRQGS